MLHREHGKAYEPVLRYQLWQQSVSMQNLDSLLLLLCALGLEPSGPVVLSARQLVRLSRHD